MGENMSEAILRNSGTIFKMLDLFEKLTMNMMDIEKRLIDLETKVL